MADEILKEEQKATTPTTGTRQVTNANDTINQIYDTQLQSQKDSLNAAMEKSLSEQQAAADKIAPQYQQSANDLATQYERNRMNFNAQALQSGINTGAGSQAELARNSEYQRDFGNLRTSEAEATATAERQMAQTKSDYQLQIQQAIANNDSKRAEALLAQYKEDQTKLENNAKTLASTGDFSGYYNYYTSHGYSAADAQKMVDNMRSYWIASNPKTAYGMGMIDLAEYNRIANPGKTSGGGYGGGGGGGDGEDAEDKETTSLFSSAYNAKSSGKDAASYIQSLYEQGYSTAELKQAATYYDGIKTGTNSVKGNGQGTTRTWK